MDSSDDTAGAGWTNAEHSSYLNSVEAFFTHKLYARGFSQFPVYGADGRSDGGVRMGQNESLAPVSGLTSDDIVSSAPINLVQASVTLRENYNVYLEHCDSLRCLRTTY